jgi:hypothetical protein
MMDQWGIEPAPLRFLIQPPRKRFRDDSVSGIRTRTLIKPVQPGTVTRHVPKGEGMAVRG